MKIQTYDLSNGLKLVDIHMPGVNSVAVMAGVKVGSRHEPKGLYGAAHFVEHTVFKGTTKRPTAKDVSEPLEALGGDSNAFTDKEVTAFHAHVSKHDGAVAVDVIHDILSNALFRTEDIEKERDVIREEISMYDNDDFNCAIELSDRIGFKGTGLEHRITGSIEDVSFSADALRSFFRAHYTPSRTTVILAGATTSKLLGIALQKFSDISPRDFNTFIDSSMPSAFSGGFDFEIGKTDRLSLIFRLPAVPKSHPDSNALEILSLALGGYTSGRLFQSLREDKGLCYSVGSYLHQHSDVGALCVYTALDQPKFAPAVEAVFAEFKALQKDGLYHAEIEKAMTHYRGKTLLSIDDPMSVATDYLRQVHIHGSYESPDERIERFMNTQSSRIQAAARMYLNPSRIHVSVVGPKEAKEQVMGTLQNLL